MAQAQPQACPSGPLQALAPTRLDQGPWAGAPVFVASPTVKRSFLMGPGLGAPVFTGSLSKAAFLIWVTPVLDCLDSSMPGGARRPQDPAGAQEPAGPRAFD
jgi:hypothetical protein